MSKKQKKRTQRILELLQAISLIEEPEIRVEVEAELARIVLKHDIKIERKPKVGFDA